MEADIYHVKIEYEGQSEEKFVMVEKGKTVTADFVWRIYYGNLIINTKIAGKLYISGEYKGEIKNDGKIEIRNIKEGTYKLKMVYTENVEEKNIEVKGGITESVYFNWTKGYGNLKIKANEDVKVYVDGKYVHDLKKGGNLVLERLEEREYAVKFEGKTTETKRVEIKRDKTEEISYVKEIVVKLRDMVLVEGGTYTMGDTFGDGQDDEKPIHSVTLSSFYMGKYEVTFEEYDEYCNATGKNKASDERYENKWNGRGKRPVINVSWYDAVEYCNWLSEKEGIEKVYSYSIKNNKLNNISCNWKANGYRLPTEAEWEYAARSKGKKYKYAWGNGEPYINGKKAGNICDESQKIINGGMAVWKGYDDGYAGTSPVGIFMANEIGLYDMTGNVWEWCWDWYESGYYSKSESTNPKGGNGFSRVLRGGSWYSIPISQRVSYRGNFGQDVRDFSVGFRLVRSGF